MRKVISASFKSVWARRWWLALGATLLLMVSLRASLTQSLCIGLMKSGSSSVQLQLLKSRALCSALAGDSPETEALLLALSLQYGENFEVIDEGVKVVRETRGKIFLSLANYKCPAFSTKRNLIYDKIVKRIDDRPGPYCRLGWPESVIRAVNIRNAEFLNAFLLPSIFYFIYCEDSNPISDAPGFSIALLNYAADPSRHQFSSIQSALTRPQFDSNLLGSLATLACYQSLETKIDILQRLISKLSEARSFQDSTQALTAIFIFFFSYRTLPLEAFLQQRAAPSGSKE